MKRSHRRSHRVVWVVLLLCVAAVIGLALDQRPALPTNPAWPPALAPARA